MLIFTFFSSTNNSVFLTEKPDEHNYSKNHLEMDSEVDEFDRQIAHLTKISSDEDNTVELSDDEKKSEEVKSRVDNLSSLAPDLLNESLEKPNINFRSASPRTDGTKEFKDAKEETTRKVNYLAKLTKSNPKQGLLKSVSSQNTERVDEDDNLNESEDERKSLYANRSSTTTKAENAHQTKILISFLIPSHLKLKKANLQENANILMFATKNCLL